jgi:hypothetical protein
MGFADDAVMRGRWPVQGTMTHDNGTTEDLAPTYALPAIHGTVPPLRPPFA